jgi:ATP-dependent DNA helicase RecG
METAELIEIVSRGEDSRHQFKSNFTNEVKLAQEIVAFSNSGGGQIVIGVDDGDHTVHGLAAADIHRLNQLVSNAASQHVRPAVNPITENVALPQGTVMVVTILDGVARPYMDKDGVIWVKTGADKRKATSREEIQRMFQQSSLVHADEVPVTGTGVGDVDLAYFETFFDQQPFDAPLAGQSVSLPQLLSNMNLMRGESLNLAAVLLFARGPQYRLPAFIAKAIAYPGVEPDEAAYLDSRDIVGKLADVFQQALGFLSANTGTHQSDRGVNSTGEPEIPRIVWEELVANALVHRDYFVIAPIRIFVYADRVEIISPGHLPNNLTVENILKGNSNIRNPVLASFAAKLLPYRGLGNGILRAKKAYAEIEFKDDREGNLFQVTVTRPGRS